MRSRSSHVMPAAASAVIALLGLNSTVSFLREMEETLVFAQTTV